VENVTEAIADAGEVRVAILLGSGQPGRAKKSAYKSICVAFVFAFCTTSIIFIAGESLPVWLTTDPLLQNLIADLIPLFGVGNITLTLGTMCWTLVGAQNRYRLATCLGVAGSWLVVIPMSAVMTIVYRINLQGQTAAVVIGYMLSGFVTNIVLLRSDWKKLSDEVILYNAANDISLSSDSDDDDSSSSSSSSASSSALSAANEMHDDSPTPTAAPNEVSSGRSPSLASPLPSPEDVPQIQTSQHVEDVDRSSPHPNRSPSQSHVRSRPAASSKDGDDGSDSSSSSSSSSSGSARNARISSVRPEPPSLPSRPASEESMKFL
jgi:MatE